MYSIEVSSLSEVYGGVQEVISWDLQIPCSRGLEQFHRWSRVTNRTNTLQQMEEMEQMEQVQWHGDANRVNTLLVEVFSLVLVLGTAPSRQPHEHISLEVHHLLCSRQPHEHISRWTSPQYIVRVCALNSNRVNHLYYGIQLVTCCSTCSC